MYGSQFRSPQFIEMNGDEAGNKFPHHEIDYTDWDKSIAIFGDSCSYGQYLNTGDRLHEILYSQWRRPVNNFGYPAEGNFHIFKKFLRAVTEHGLPLGVVVGYSTPWRIAYVENNFIESVGWWSEKWEDKTIGQRAAVNFLENCKDTLFEQNLDIIKAIRLMCKDIHYYEWTPFTGQDYYEDVYRLEWTDRASDNVHPGPETMKFLAGKIREEFKL